MTSAEKVILIMIKSYCLHLIISSRNIISRGNQLIALVFYVVSYLFKDIDGLKSRTRDEKILTQHLKLLS